MSDWDIDNEFKKWQKKDTRPDKPPKYWSENTWGTDNELQEKNIPKSSINLKSMLSYLNIDVFGLLKKVAKAYLPKISFQFYLVVGVGIAILILAVI